MEHEEQHGNRELPPDNGPRIYVASLSDYNAGRLHGRWISADLDRDEVHQAISEMLTQSIEPGAEEWAIHDYDGFGPWQLSEHEEIDAVLRVAEGIATHGIAFAHWAAEVGTDVDDLRAFEDHYLGQWSSMEAFAEELVEDFGIEQALEQIPEPFRWYVQVDIESFARDLESDHLTSEDADGVHIWDNQW